MPKDTAQVFAEHWPLILAIINGLVLALTAVVGWSFKREAKYQEERYQHQNVWQREQDSRLKTLEDRMGTVNGQLGIAQTERQILGKGLEELVRRFEKAVEKAEHALDALDEKNDAAHERILKRLPTRG